MGRGENDEMVFGNSAADWSDFRVSKLLLHFVSPEYRDSLVDRI